MSEKSWYKKWYFGLILIFLLVIIIGFLANSNLNNNDVNSNTISNNEITYNISKSIFENGGKKKTEKIVINNKDISNDEIEKIYNARKKVNQEVDLKIWLFSNEENANNMNNAEIADASYSEDNDIVINNYEAERVAQEKAEKEEAERKKQEEEQKQREEQERIEEEQRQKEEEEKQKIANASLGEKNALNSAKQYLNYTAFSYKGLVEQLEFEGYTSEEAKFGADNCGADWNEQAAKSAKQYMNYSSFSRSGLLEQLEFEGFTPEQAEYGVKAVGY